MRTGFSGVYAPASLKFLPHFAVPFEDMRSFSGVYAPASLKYITLKSI